MTIRPVGAELFHADGRTDMTKLIVDFPNFAMAPQKVNLYIVSSKPHFYCQSVRLEVRTAIKITAVFAHRKFQQDLFNG